MATGDVVSCTVVVCHIYQGCGPCVGNKSIAVEIDSLVTTCPSKSVTISNTTHRKYPLNFIYLKWLKVKFYQRQNGSRGLRKVRINRSLSFM